MNRLSANPLIGRALKIAVREVGIIKVASKLGVTPVMVDGWMTGNTAMPHDKFLALVDLLLEVKPSWDAWDRN